MIIRTNAGDIVGDLVRKNKKTVVVEVMKTKEVKTKTKVDNKVEIKTELVKETRYVKRRLKDVIAF